jgi:hypothetical protein
VHHGALVVERWSLLRLTWHLVGEGTGEDDNRCLLQAFDHWANSLQSAALAVSAHGAMHWIRR